MGKSILVVDDDADDRELINEALQEIDTKISCVYAKEGFEALDILSKPANALPDFIILDLNMPRLSGNQCLALIKKSERLRLIPVIIFTTSRLESDVEEARNLGAILFLTKPSRFSELVETLRYAIEIKWESIKDNW
jgi:CheY-like chemotaxis protein